MIFKLFKHILLWVGFLFASTVEAYDYKCPEANSDPVVIQVPYSGSQKIRVKRSSWGSLCTLTCLTSSNSTVGIGSLSITRNANNSDFNIIPVSRSYDNRKWEKVAGPYTEELQIQNCNKKACDIVLPSLDNLEPHRYVLMTREQDLPINETVARFLMQATFGPTMSDIDDLGRSKQSNFEQWIRSQVDMEPTYHREYFRKYAHSSLFEDKVEYSTRPSDPCLNNSIWREYAFTPDDYDKMMDVSQLTDGRFLLSVDSIPRTVIDSWKDTRGRTLDVGTFNFCPRTEEVKGGNLQVRPSGFGCKGVQGGNPQLFLPDSILNDETYSNDLTRIDLPDRSMFEDVNALLTPNSERFQFGSGLRLTSTVKDAICSQLPVGDYQNLIGIIAESNSLVMYAGYMNLKNNTVEQPIGVPGGAEFETAAICPNVEKSYLNLESCFLSTNADACSSMKSSASWILNDSNNERLYDVTGNYIYTVTGLRSDDTPSPCTVGYTHRWIKIIDIDSSCTSSGVNEETVSTLQMFLKKYGWDSNDNMIEYKLKPKNSNSGTCDPTNTKGMKLSFEGGCFQHSHPDEQNVYDFTYWTLPNTHPGNTGAAQNPIKKWVNNNFVLKYPSWHPMSRWENEKKKFDYLGRSGDEISFRSLPGKLRLPAVRDEFGDPDSSYGVVVCGSPGEVMNRKIDTNVFHFSGNGNVKRYSDLSKQKSHVWIMIALQAADQLRQRVAWALSQILVITPNQIRAFKQSESYLNYYDIFVRHAFSSYRSILKEVAYSPMMGEMLSYLESKSTAFVLEAKGILSYPDENFAREIMQLFSIGLYQLNLDGTRVLDPGTNSPMPTYTNNNIQTFARAWTGFYRVEPRGNIEGDDANRMDPMVINGYWRDAYPKMDLNEGYIGDMYPLCADLPDYQFLRKGATYRLLGSTTVPDLHSQPSSWASMEEDVEQIQLSTSSKLYKQLCNAGSSGCDFKSIVRIQENLTCTGEECYLDNLRVVRVQTSPPIYYEYVRPPCVDLSFYNNGLKITRTNPKISMCANPNLQVAMSACCLSSKNVAVNLCKFSSERLSYSRSRSRCRGESNIADTCDWRRLRNSNCDWNEPEKYHWSNISCNVLAKVNEEGMVSIVHSPSTIDDNAVLYTPVRTDNPLFFPVKWDSDGSYPKPSNQCSNDACQSISDGCLCEVDIEEVAVFSSMPTADEVRSTLKIGSAPITSFNDYGGAISSGLVKAYHKTGGTPYDKDTVFEMEYNGKTTFFKNILSTVVVKSKSGGKSQFTFRNPPQFLNLALHDRRDAEYETEAVLDHLFYHENVAPFLSIAMLKRFGVSNPSPRYVKVVATAFRDGSYENFGNGEYGTLEPMIAAILLDRESRSIVVDNDTSAGGFREPLIKLVSFMRAMAFVTASDSPEVRLQNLSISIGQMPHLIPNVFSYFSPDYAVKGQIKKASLTSPEAEILTGPNIIGFLNGMISLIDLGWTECFGGFGEKTTKDCDNYDISWDATDSRGRLTYNPSQSDAGSVVDELALLLTGGRLNSDARELIKDAYNGEESAAKGLKVAQKLMVTTVEFHTSSLFETNASLRPDLERTPPSNRQYKALIYVKLDGGADSYNILVPHSGCSGRDLYQDYENIRNELSLSKSSLLQLDAASSGQPCSKFGLHPNLGFLKSLYDAGDLSFIANMGVLQEHVTKDNWKEKSKRTSLFAHNIQSNEVANVDIFNEQAGTGLMGRMADILKDQGYSPGTISVEGTSRTLFSESSPLLVFSPESFEEFNPIPWSQDLKTRAKRLNKATKLGSGLIGETWANTLFQALDDNELLFDSLSTVDLSTSFPDTKLGDQFESIATLIKTRDARGTDRDIFYADLGGFDSHADLEGVLTEKTTIINDALKALKDEMVAQGRWSDVTVCFVSEFGRTLTENTSEGSDHAWGGHYFYAGGEVKGGKIFGSYPSDLRPDGPFIVAPGIVIPKFPWDGFWNGVAQWFGITRTSDLNELLPNRNSFSSDLLRGTDLFNRVDNPSLPPISTPIPSPSPTPQPTVSSPPITGAPCVEDPNSIFFYGKDEDGVVMINTCSWLEGEQDKEKHCSNETHYYTIDSENKIFPPPQVACPITCENYCDPCFENKRTSFFLKKKYDGTPVFRTCNHLARQSQSIIDQMCLRSESYEGYPVPSIGCPITCGISECVSHAENEMIEAIVDHGRNGSRFFEN